VVFPFTCSVSESELSDELDEDEEEEEEEEELELLLLLPFLASLAPFPFTLPACVRLVRSAGWAAASGDRFFDASLAESLASALRLDGDALRAGSERLASAAWPLVSLEGT